MRRIRVGSQTILNIVTLYRAQFNTLICCNGKTNGINIRKIAILTITIISFFETTHPMTTSTERC